MTRPPRTDRQTFLTRLRQSGLLSAEQLQQIAARLPDSSRGRVVARAMVAMGVLTKFQAEQLLAGRTGGFFLGQYRILEQLGQGGMGRVFKAEHLAMGRLVALKVLSNKVIKSGRGQELFAREVRAAAVLSHPNIVTAFDANQVGDRWFLVLEYINGPNLDQLVREKGPLPVGQACDFIRQIAGGLHYAHLHGMVHRDIKPANLLLQHGVNDQNGTYGVVKISDFGLARLGETDPHAADNLGTILTKDNTVMGTPDFLSPEQARCLHKTDIRSDLYSLGCTFYYLLTGEVPYSGGTTLEKLIRHSTEDPAPIGWLRAGVPAGVIAIVRKLMAKDPAERFQTPAELAEALVPFAVHRPAAWAAPVPADPFVDPLPTPESSGEGPIPGLAIVDDAAQLATVGPDQSPTPVSVVQGVTTARLSASLAEQQRRRIRLALFWAAGIVGTLLTAAIMATVLFRS